MIRRHTHKAERVPAMTTGGRLALLASVTVIAAALCTRIAMAAGVALPFSGDGNTIKRADLPDRLRADHLEPDRPTRACRPTGPRRTNGTGRTTRTTGTSGSDRGDRGDRRDWHDRGHGASRTSRSQRRLDRE
jgi:hypothetical protein